MSAQNYKLVTELVRPGDHLDCPRDSQPVVEPSARPGFLRVTYLTPVTRVPFEDDSPVTYVD